MAESTMSHPQLAELASQVDGRPAGWRAAPSARVTLEQFEQEHAR